MTSSSTVFRTSVVVVCLVGAIIRCFSARGDLWLDELWGQMASQGMQYPWEAFGPGAFDGHASLMTFWVAKLPAAAASILFRLPALVFAILTLLVLLGKPFCRNRAETLVVSVLASFSYLLVLYGTEARGYSGMLLFGCLAIHFLDRALQTQSSREAFLYGISASLAILFHLSFLSTLFALCLWSEIQVNRREKYPRAIVSLLKLHVLPLLTTAGLFLAKPTFLFSGGGPLRESGEVLLSSISILGGGREFVGLSGVALLLSAGLVVLVLVAVLWELRSKDSTVGLFALVSVVAPVCLVIFFRPKFLLPRYFLFPMLCFLILLARRAADLFQGTAIKRVVATALIGVVLAGNGGLLYDLVTVGRGQYREAIGFILREDQEQQVSVASDFDFRNFTVLDYYLPEFSDGHRLKKILADDSPDQAPRWFIAHSLYPGEVRPPQFTIDEASYALIRSFPSSPLSGMTWYLYRRIDS